MKDVAQHNEWAARADEIVAEAARQEGVALPTLFSDALAQAVRVHWLSQPGVFALVEAFANCERDAGRLAGKSPVDFVKSLEDK